MARELRIIVRVSDMVTKALSNIRGKIQKFGASVKKTFQAFSKFQNLIIGFAAFRIGKSFIDAASKIEVFQKQLMMVTGSAEEAADALATIREFARTSPLETEDVVQAYVRLRAVGINPTIEQFKTLGGVAVLMNREVTEVLQAFIGLNKRTLRELGVDIDRTGKQAVIQSGDIRKVVEKDNASIRQALLEIWEERFPNAIEVAAGTFTAQMAIMRSNIFEFQAQLMQRFMPAMTQFVSGLSNMVEKSQGGIQQIQTGILGLVAIFRTLWNVVTLVENTLIAGMIELGLVILGVSNTAWQFAQGIVRSFIRIGKAMHALVKRDFAALKEIITGFDDDFAGAILHATATMEALSSVNKTWSKTAKKDLNDIANAWGMVSQKVGEAQGVIGGLGGGGALGAGGAGEEDPISKFRRSMKDLGPGDESLQNFEQWQKSITETWRKEAEERAMIADREANKIANFSQSLGFAIASGFGKGAEGLKESLKNSLIVTLNYVQRKIILQRVAALADALTKGPLAPIALIKAGAQIAAVSALFAGAKAAVNSFASGTQFAPGGMARVHRDETVFLPRGSQVVPAGRNDQGQSNVTIAPVFQGPVDRETAPQIINKLDELGDMITRASRQGYINWQEVITTTP